MHEYERYTLSKTDPITEYLRISALEYEGRFYVQTWEGVSNPPPPSVPNDPSTNISCSDKWQMLAEAEKQWKRSASEEQYTLLEHRAFFEDETSL